MKPAPFDYERPSSISEACRILDEAGGGATLIAGGQTLMPLLNLRMSQPFVLVDLGGIAELHAVSRTDGATRIGPMLTQNAARADGMIARHVPILAHALAHVGHHQTRNRGTVGGSIALGEPAAECPATAVALGATIQLQSAHGARSVAAEEFYVGPYMTTAEPDEIVTSIDFPDWPDGTTMLFREVAQRPGDFALVGLVGALAVSDGVIARAGIAWFGMGPTPVKARQAEQALAGTAITAIDPLAIADLAIADTAPFDDQHASAEYRRTVGRKIFQRTLSEALQLEVAA